MFTGIVEEVGKVRYIQLNGNSGVLAVKAAKVLEGTKIGDSIAVNGVCLTVTSLQPDGFTADVMAETIRRSSLGNCKIGSYVNLERAMAADGRFGGHIVSGHIDGTGVIRSMIQEENAVWVSIKTSQRILDLIVEKGSVCIDGISLTVAKVDDEGFQVSVIPHTGEETIFLKKASGDLVNLENDIIGKYVEKLMENGYAYETSTAIYFDVSKLDKYPILTNIDVENQKAGARVDVDPEKRNPYDFALWIKAPENHLMKWDSPWGVGYPGWHIECSCIGIKHLGEYMDIHCGGVDNIFPHHTNEIAQSESYLGHKWCNYWFHVQHLNDKSGKMSKSKGDFLTVSLLQEKGYDPIVYRMFCLQSHYRKPLEFSYEIMDNTKAAYNKLVKRVAGLKKEGETDQNVFAEYKAKFVDAISNDLNTSMAITVLYDLLKADTNDITKYELIKDFDKVLSLNLENAKSTETTEGVDAELESFVLAKIEERKEAKKAKDFAKADAIRDELLAKGIVIKDTREGVVWHKAE